jgi:hypothetical protein
MSENSTSDLAGAIGQFLGAAMEEGGFKLPLYLVAVAVNGTMTFVRYVPSNGENADDGLTPELLAEHTEGAGFQLPINVALIDSTGEAARMLIRGPGEPEFFWPDSLPSD